jgi:hypothetical protein|tara:strand:+ start:1704 stop:1994 length:291 start_codon:yes stop_codon:yes gene_type:complete
MREVDRMKLLVCDSIDTMSRMGDRTMTESAKGISEHLEQLLLAADDDSVEDVVASSLIVMLAILKPVAESMLAMSSDRHARARSKNESVTETTVYH